MRPSTRSTERPKRGKPRGMRRDRDCLTCKARSVKCDLNRPGCGPCLGEGLPCEGYAQRIVLAMAGPEPSTTNSKRKLHTPSDVSQQLLASTVGESSPPSGSTSSSRSRRDNAVTSIPSPITTTGTASGDEDDSNWTTHYFNYLVHFRELADQSVTIRWPRGEIIGHDTESLVNDPLSSIWNFAWKRMAQHITTEDMMDIDCALSHTAAVKTLCHAIEHGGILAIFGIVTFAFIDVYKGPFGA